MPYAIQAFAKTCYTSVHIWNPPSGHRYFWNLAYLIKKEKDDGERGNF